MSLKERVTVLLEKILNIGTTAYLLVMLGMLPLYHKDGFIMLGDVKYRVFFQVSMLFVPILLILIGVLSFLKRSKNRWSLTDWCALAYAIVVLISFLLSAYKDIALYGYTDWHMGLLSQLLFVGIYFCVSRGFRWNEKMVWYLCTVSGLVFLLGLLNRYAFDPLSMYGGLEYWNKTHLLATIGNINWYCGYLCVFFPIGFYYYWNGSQAVFKRVLTIIYVAVAFGTIFTQGSESGLVAFAVIMAAYFFFSFDSNIKMKRFMEAGILLGIVSLLLRAAYYYWKERAYFGVDLPIVKIITSNLWIYFTIFMLGSYAIFLLYRKEPSIVKKIIPSGLHCRGVEDVAKAAHHRVLAWVCLLLLAILLSMVMIHAWKPAIFPGLSRIPYLNFNESWGSGRGQLWPVAYRAFAEMPLINQLFGVGPDCFAPYMYTHYGSQLQGFLKGWWGDAIVANAHNEWLNVLVNTGVLGVLTYCGVILTEIRAAVRDREANPLLLAFAMSMLMYSVNATASFQQVMSTPFLFLMVGMAENKRKKDLPKSSDCIII